MQKECIKCKVVHDVSKFCRDKYRKDGLHPYCRLCKLEEQRQRERAKRQVLLYNVKIICKICQQNKICIEFMRNNKIVKEYPICNECKNRLGNCVKGMREVKIKKGNKKRKDKKGERKLKILSMLGNKCYDCGLEVSLQWPSPCFDFHHLNQNDKKYLVSNLLKRDINDLTLMEVKKCIILCSNCHRKIHYQQNRQNHLLFERLNLDYTI